MKCNCGPDYVFEETSDAKILAQGISYGPGWVRDDSSEITFSIYGARDIAYALLGSPNEEIWWI